MHEAPVGTLYIQKAEALAKFKEALAVPGIGEWKEPCEKRIKELEADAK